MPADLAIAALALRTASPRGEARGWRLGGPAIAGVRRRVDRTGAKFACWELDDVLVPGRYRLGSDRNRHAVWVGSFGQRFKDESPTLEQWSADAPVSDVTDVFCYGQSDSSGQGYADVASQRWAKTP